MFSLTPLLFFSLICFKFQNILSIFSNFILTYNVACAFLQMMHMICRIQLNHAIPVYIDIEWTQKGIVKMEETDKEITTQMASF